MELPSYEGIIEKWKANLIIQRAKRCGFKPHEWPDAMQEAVLATLAFRYDPHHAQGATERTALTTVIDHCLKKMSRSATRYRRHVERFGQTVHQTIPAEPGQLAVDMSLAIADLTERERIVCQGLAEGLSLSQIASQMGCGWHAVKRIKVRLRQRFEEIGLEGWVRE